MINSLQSSAKKWLLTVGAPEFNDCESDSSHQNYDSQYNKEPSPPFKASLFFKVFITEGYGELLFVVEVLCRDECLLFREPLVDLNIQSESAVEANSR